MFGLSGSKIGEKLSTAQNNKDRIDTGIHSIRPIALWNRIWKQVLAQAIWQHPIDEIITVKQRNHEGQGPYQ